MAVGDYINKGIKFLTEPSKSFEAEKKTGLNDAFKYVLVLAIIVAVLGAIVTTIMTAFGMSFAPAGTIPGFTTPIVFVSSLVGGYIVMIIFLVIWGLWQHLWAFVLGAKNGLEQTMKTVFYGMTPHYLLGWIPVINFITPIWSFVLMGLGLMKYHGMSGGKAALALIIAIIIPAIIIGVIAITFFATMFGVLGGLQPDMWTGLY